MTDIRVKLLVCGLAVVALIGVGFAAARLLA